MDKQFCVLLNLELDQNNHPQSEPVTGSFENFGLLLAQISDL